MIKTLRKLMVKGIHQETGRMLVATDNNYTKPAYPYYSYKFTTLRQNVGEGGVYKEGFDKSTDPKFKHDLVTTLEFQPKVVMSFNAYSNDLVEAQDEILKAWEWFKLKGRRLLSKENIVVVDVGNIQDRSTYMVGAYEFRQGFDVEFRVLHQFSDRSETIESYTINGKIEGGKE